MKLKDLKVNSFFYLGIGLAKQPETYCLRTCERNKLIEIENVRTKETHWVDANEQVTCIS